MPDPITVRLDTRGLDALAANLDVSADRIIAALATEMVGDIQSSFGSSPSEPGDPPGVDTGALRASIHSEQVKYMQYAVSDGVEYGAYLEYGTPHMAARPWMTPAIFKIMVTFTQRWKALFE